MKEISENNPVVVFYNNKEDFAIGIQTTIQGSMMRKFGHQNRFNSRNNGYHFSLVTIVVINEFGDGYPVGWCLKNERTSLYWKTFLNQLRKE